MPPPDCRQERLHSSHALRGFICGKPQLDDWLRSSALNAEKSGTARTRVWIDDSDAVVAYFSLAPHIVARAEIEPKLGRGSPDSIPSILLARLALHRDRHGHGEGSLLLVDALTMAVDGIRGIGGRLIAVDAIDEDSAAFYDKHGFTRCSGRAGRLVMKASDAAASLDLPWP